MLAVRRSMKINDALVEELTAIKHGSQNRVHFFAVANLSHDDYVQACTLGLDWTLFDQILLSSDLGMQKPELRFYRRVLSMIGVPAEDAVLVDNDPDNVLAALSLGLQHVSSLRNPLSFCFEKFTDFGACHQDARRQQRARKDSAFSDENVTKRCLQSVTEVVLKGTRFLQDNAKTFFSYTSTGVKIDDNFAQLMILELTGDRSV